MFRTRAVGWLVAVSVALAAGAFTHAAEESGNKVAASEEATSDRPRTKSARKVLEELKRQRARHAKRPERKGKDAAAAVGAENERDTRYIDEMLAAEWKATGFPVSDECAEGEFVRRASLDIIGRIPSLEETKAYLRDRGPNRKAKLIERLLASEEYGRNFATIWTNLMMPRNAQNNQRLNPEGLSAWLEKEFNRNTPWDQMVRALIAASGKWNENGAVCFIVANKTNGNVDLTATVTKLFLCVQTQCTQCHDHPWNEWKQSQFHGLNSFFVGTQDRRATKTLDSGQSVTDYFEVTETAFEELPANERGTYFEPRSGITEFTLPTYLDGRDLDTLLGRKAEPGALVLDDEIEEQEAQREPTYLRQELARVITAPDNPYFARAIVNRMWFHFFGHSFTKNVDDFDNGQDEPTMPELLDRLADDFRASGHDLKSLVRWITRTRAYSLSSVRKGKAANEDAIGFFTFMLARPLTAAQMYESVLTLTGASATSKNENTAAEKRQFINEFERAFGSDEAETSAPKFNGTITQALMMMNSPLMERCTQCAPGSFLHKLATDPERTVDEKVDTLYLAALARTPTGAERQQIGAMLTDAGPDGVPAVLSDVLWVLLNSSEFVLNH